MVNKPKILDDEEAFKATEGRRIAKIEQSTNSIEIKFTDGSHITIEMRVPYIYHDHGEGNYCYCSDEPVDVNSYFSEAK